MYLKISLFVISTIIDHVSSAFISPQPSPHAYVSHNNRKFPISNSISLNARYGPQEIPDPDAPFFAGYDNWEQDDSERIARQKVGFEQLIATMIETDMLELPSLLTQNLDLLLSVRGYEGENLINEAMEQANETGDMQYIDQVGMACEYLLSFLTEFVEQAQCMDDANKNLLGKIILTATDPKKNENDLDEVINEEKDNFTPGFLRHIEGECDRITASQNMTPESAKMLQVLRIVQTRVLEELGAELGEGASVLSQLLGYDDDEERSAVLGAGLTVRGADFAEEMLAMTQEALNDFQSFPDGQVDPELVRRVQGIDGELKSFIENSLSPDVGCNFDNSGPGDGSFNFDDFGPGITSDSDDDWM